MYDDEMPFSKLPDRGTKSFGLHALYETEISVLGVAILGCACVQ
jgi:hypothetical protein